MRTFLRCLIAAGALLWAGYPAGTAAAPADDLRQALLWYEDCESPSRRNKDLGIRINSATLVEGKIGHALLLERRDANHLANPDFDGPGDWIVVGRPLFRSTGGRFSPGCVQLTASDYVRQVATGLRSGDKTWYCLSAYAKADSPGTRLELGVDRELHQEFALTTQYTRLALPFQATHENSTVTFRARGSGPITLDAVQLEQQRSFPSSFYAKALRPTQSIDIPVGERTLHVDQGSIAFWIQPLWLRENGAGQNLFAWWADADNPGVDCLTLSAIPAGMTTDHEYRNRLLFMRTRGRRHEGFAVKSFPLCQWTPGSWHHIVAAWRAHGGPAGQLRLYLDGEALPAQELALG